MKFKILVKNRNKLSKFSSKDILLLNGQNFVVQNRNFLCVI